MVDLTTLRTPIVLNGCETEDPFKREHHRHGTPFSPAFAGRETLSLTELAEQPLILSNRYRKYMLSAFRAGGSVLRYLSHLRGRPHGNDNGRKGLGIALLPASMLNLTHKLKAFTITDADLTTRNPACLAQGPSV